MSRRPILLCCLLGVLGAGCTVGPDYTRPAVPVPATYRAAAPGPPGAGAATFGELAWGTVFPDPELQALIRTALAENYDLRVAVARILQAQSQVTIARAQQFPTVEAGVQAPYAAVVGGERPPGTARDSFEPLGGAGVAWELDLWGKFRRNTEAAWADLLATEEVRYAVTASLVAQVAQAYLTLRTLDLTLEISQRTVTSRAQSRDLVQARVDGGVAGILDLRQAETLLYGATKTIPEIQRQIEQTENVLSLLLGRPPGPIPRGRPLGQQVAAPTVPVGLPSDLLARRPDIRGAEQQLVAATAQIGVAKALLFPQVTLSGFAGAGGAVISGSSFGPYGVFNVLPAVTLPLFNMGRLQAGVAFNEARTQEAVLRYQQTIQQALRDVADALIEIQKRREFRAQQELLVRTLDDASQVAKLRYEGGVSSFLEVLDTERQLFEAELQLAQAQRDEFVGVVQLYKALGGGWQAEGTVAPPRASGDDTPPAAATSVAARHP
jgi:multidrug efflux system outer membrane protein